MINRHKKNRKEVNAMKVIDFRFRPNTAETISGIQNSKMFKGLCEHIDFSKMKPQTVPEVVADLDGHNVVKAVITGRDCETTYGSKSNHDNAARLLGLSSAPVTLDTNGDNVQDLVSDIVREVMAKLQK
jgi:hypothetical protein